MASVVEQAYENRINAMTVAERVARGAGMFQWAREMIGRQITAEHGEMSPERLKLLIALRQYASEPLICDLIRERLRHVSD
ncbi:MAG: hypothetical protein O3A00_16685 [Planctomycetota bacterium]|nr:hypothetical protein [Planctomycetota bacterium]